MNCVLENTTVSPLHFQGLGNYIMVMKECLFLRKYTLKYFEAKRHDVCNLL